MEISSLRLVELTLRSGGYRRAHRGRIAFGRDEEVRTELSPGDQCPRTRTVEGSTRPRSRSGLMVKEFGETDEVQPESFTSIPSDGVRQKVIASLASVS